MDGERFPNSNLYMKMKTTLKKTVQKEVVVFSLDVDGCIAPRAYTYAKVRNRSSLSL